MMGRETWKIVISLLGAGAIAGCAFVLLEFFLPGGHNGGAVLLRFQVSAILAMALLAGLAIAIYARLSR